MHLVGNSYARQARERPNLNRPTDGPLERRDPHIGSRSHATQTNTLIDIPKTHATGLLAHYSNTRENPTIALISAAKSCQRLNWTLTESQPRRRVTRLTLEQLSEIISAYEGGETSYTLSDDTISASTVLAHLNPKPLKNNNDAHPNYYHHDNEEEEEEEEDNAV